LPPGWSRAAARHERAREESRYRTPVQHPTCGHENALAGEFIAGLSRVILSGWA